MPGYPGPMAYVQQPYMQQPNPPRPAPLRKIPPAQQAAAPKPVRPTPPAIVRGQSPDDPRPARRSLEMPSPEALGVSMPAKPVDWTDVRIKLDRLGAREFTLTMLPDGGYRFAFQLPSQQIVEGRGVTEAEAVQRALGALR